MITEKVMPNKKFLVTGASGFIGSHLCERLVLLGGDVHCISRTKRQNDLHNMTWWQSDLSGSADVLKIIKSIEPEIVYHLSSCVTGSRDTEVILPTFQSNLLSTLNLLIALKIVGCQRIILAGSMEEPHIHSAELSSISPYSVSKWASSTYGRMFNTLYGVPVVILHLFMVYGPGQTDLKKLIPYVIISLLKNQAPRLTSGNRQIDWIYIDDVIDALIESSRAKDIIGQTIDVGSGSLATVREVVEKLIALINSKIKPDFRALEDRPFESVRIADTKSAFAALGWKGKVQLIEGLRRTVAWYYDHLIK